MDLTAKRNGVYDRTDKLVTVSGTVTAGTVDGPDPVMLTITDADHPQIVRLVLADNSIAEGESTQVSSRLEWPQSHDTTVTVGPRPPLYTVTGAVTMTIPKGATTFSSSVTIAFADDGLDGPDKSFAVTATASNDLAGVEHPAPVTLYVSSATAPGAPTVGTASKTSLYLTWVAPDNTGNPATTDYDVRY